MFKTASMKSLNTVHRKPVTPWITLLVYPPQSVEIIGVPEIADSTAVNPNGSKYNAGVITAFALLNASALASPSKYPIYSTFLGARWDQ